MALPALLSGSKSQSSTPYVVSFDDIVSAHFAVDHGEGAHLPEDDRSERQEELKSLWRQFAAQEGGQVVSSFFGQFGNTGAALTMRVERHRFMPIYWLRPRLHVALDLAMAGAAADLVSRYERIRVKADQLLAGAEREHVTRVLYDRLCRVIRIVDQMLALDQFKANPRLESLAEVFGRSESTTFLEVLPTDDNNRKANANSRSATRRNVSKESEKRITNALKVAETEASQAEDLCSRAVRRGAMMAYFVGMLVGIVVFTVSGVALGTLLSHVHIAGFDVERFLTVFIAGAVGAIVSVMSRMSTGDSWLEYETARSYLRVLGMFRPLIGAIFGVALYFGIQSGVLQFIKPPVNADAVFFFFAFIAFLAGFSERWAGDVLVPIKERASRTAPSTESTSNGAPTVP